MQTDILGKRLLIIVAHPDDESFLVAGTIHANYLAKGKNFILCASCGEKGHTYTDVKLSSSKLKKIRKDELIKVSKYLNVDNLKILNLPDGSINEHQEILKKEVDKFIRQSCPDYIISFGKDGYTEHADHIIIGKIVKVVARLHKVPFIEFVKPSNGICANLDKHLVAKRKNGVYMHECMEKVKSNLKIKINPLIKLKALSLHKSQFEGLNPYKIFPKKTADHFLSYEYFHLFKS